MLVFRRLVWIGAVTIAAAVVAAPAYAQGGGQQNTGVGIGALGGLTFTTANADSAPADIDLKGDKGFLVGIWFGGNRDGRVGVMGELSYVTKKIKDGASNDTLQKEYVEIPVLLRINAGSRAREGASLYVLAGPVFDIQISVKENGEKVDSPSDLYQGLDIGFMGGLGFEVARIGVEGRYAWGLRSVLATDAAIESGFGSVKFNTFQVLLKVRFN